MSESKTRSSKDAVNSETSKSGLKSGLKYHNTSVYTIFYYLPNVHSLSIIASINDVVKGKGGVRKAV